MKKKKTIILVVVLALVGALNLMQPFQNAIAYPCNPWDPGYNFLTGECDDPDPYTGEAEVGGEMCYITVYYPTGPQREYSGYDAIDCTWAVAGECTPVSCEEVLGL